MKNLFVYIRNFAFLLAGFGLTIVISCRDEETCEDKGTCPVVITQYDSLMTFYEEYSNFLPDINSGDYTIFAPTNEAFQTLYNNVDAEDLRIIRDEIIVAVLNFHFIGGSESKIGSSSLVTEQGESIAFNSNGSIATGCSNTNVNYESFTESTSGAVIHEVNAVLIPPVAVCAPLGLNLGTIAQPILLTKPFSDVYGIIQVADSEVPTGEMSVAQILANQSGTSYTAFIPTNDVLTGTAAAAGITKEQLIGSVTTSPSVARGFLLNHIYDGGLLNEEDIVATVNSQTGVGTTITMMSEKEMTVIQGPTNEAAPGCTNGGSYCLYLAANPADQSTYVPIFATDVFGYQELESASNGALHVSSIIQ